MYDAPFACFVDDLDAEIRELPGQNYTYRDILLRDEEGRLLEKVDGAHPFSYPELTERGVQVCQGYKLFVFLSVCL